MNNGYTGGPAFPVNTDILSLPDPKAVMGMTLRDYFAAKALAGLCAEMSKMCLEDIELASKKAPGIAYSLADAMLAERAK